MATLDDLEWAKAYLESNIYSVSPTQAIEAIKAKIAQENAMLVLEYCEVNYGYKRLT